MQGDSAVESAEPVEIVVRKENFHAVAHSESGTELVEIVVDCGGKHMPSRLERARFKFHIGIRHVGESDLFSVEREACAETGCADFENAARRIFHQHEFAAVERGSAFAAIRGRGVERARNAHDVIRFKRIFIDVLKPRLFKETELPDAVQVNHIPFRIKRIRFHLQSFSFPGYFLFLINMHLIFYFSMIYMKQKRYF